VSARYVIKEEKDHSGWWIILIAAFLVAYGYIILIAAISAGILLLGYKLWQLHQSRRKIKQVEEENAYMYAQTQLITEGMRVWGNPEHYMDNFNDGMREWA